MGSAPIAVWWARSADAAPGLADLLDDDERTRMVRFVRGTDRSNYLVAHALARLAMATVSATSPAEVEFDRRCDRCAGPHGKPRLRHPDVGLELSLSHSGERVAVAIGATDPVGVDVERVARLVDHEDLVPVILSPHERDDLARLPRHARRRALMRYWTRKEAVLKATGDGLSIPPASLSVSRPDLPARLVSAPPGVPASMQLTDLDPDPDHVGCVAVVAPRARDVVEHDGSALLALWLAAPGGVRPPPVARQGTHAPLPAEPTGTRVSRDSV